MWKTKSDKNVNDGGCFCFFRWMSVVCGQSQINVNVDSCLFFYMNVRCVWTIYEFMLRVHVFFILWTSKAYVFFLSQTFWKTNLNKIKWNKISNKSDKKWKQIWIFLNKKSRNLWEKNRIIFSDKKFLWTSREVYIMSMIYVTRTTFTNQYA